MVVEARPAQYGQMGPLASERQHAFVSVDNAEAFLSVYVSGGVQGDGGPGAFFDTVVQVAREPCFLRMVGARGGELDTHAPAEGLRRADACGDGWRGG